MVSAEYKAILKTVMEEEDLALQELIWELFCTTEHVGKSKPSLEVMTSKHWRNCGPSGATTDLLIQNKR